MEPPKWRIMGIFAAQKLRERRQSAIFCPCLTMQIMWVTVSTTKITLEQLLTMDWLIGWLSLFLLGLLNKNQPPIWIDCFFFLVSLWGWWIRCFTKINKHRNSWESHVWSEFSIPKNTGKQMDHHHFPRDISWYSQHSSIFHIEIMLNPLYIYICTWIYMVVS